MGLKPDSWIEGRARSYRMIEPFLPGLVVSRPEGNVISYGLSSFGYDVRLDRQFKIFTPTRQSLIDPKNFKSECVDEIEADTCIIPPNSFALGRTMERFRIPPDVLCIAVGKSTYARCGVITNVTPFEPGWEGIPTLEISNTSPLPAKVYAGEGIVQVLFFQGDTAPQSNYAKRSGKYQGQELVTPPIV